MTRSRATTIADDALARSASLEGQGRLAEALAVIEGALREAPASAALHFQRGNVLRGLGRLEEALVACEAACLCDPSLAAAWGNRGALLLELHRPAEALDVLDEALRRDPAQAGAQCNRGTALRDLGRVQEAIEAYAIALARQPDFPDARLNLGLCRLLTQDFAHGWDDYEARWRKEGRRDPPVRAAPDWDGQSLDGRLLVLAEQGLGDEIFHLGLLREAAALARATIVTADARLHPLLERSFPGVAFLPREGTFVLPKVAAQVFSGSLGRWLRRDAAAFGHGSVPYLRADPARVAALRSALGAGGARLCGLSWTSRNASVGEAKSIRLDALEPVLRVPGVRFVSLQYGDTRAERAEFRARTGLEVAAPDGLDLTDDLDGVAALVEGCDYVVTVSNTVAHLAGALGKPASVLLPAAIGRFWYWHAGTARSPWYPTLHLCRQERAGGWAAPVRAAAAGLAATP